MRHEYFWIIRNNRISAIHWTCNKGKYVRAKAKTSEYFEGKQFCEIDRPCSEEGVVSKETVVLRRWGSSIQKFGFINGVDNVNWPPYRDSKS